MNIQKSNAYHKSAFTLVELIVVIVILAILATIAFLSFSSQSASARDSTRLSDMSNIAKGLSVFSAVSGKLPMPDSKIDVNASGTTILYQGYAGSNVLNMIKMSSGGGKDPLDKSTYYTYSTNVSQNKFQILGFLEDGNSSALSLVPFNKHEIPAFARMTELGTEEANADPSSYSGRYIYTKGDSIGILLSTGSMVPVQANGIVVSGGNVDIINTSSSYSMLYSKNDVITGTGLALRGAIGGEGLIGYWNFDEGAGTTINATITKDSVKSVTMTNPTMSYTGGKIGNGLYFGGSATGAVMPLGLTYNDFANGGTVSFYVKTQSGSYNGSSNAVIYIGNFWIHLYPSLGDAIQVRYISNFLHDNNILTSALTDGFCSFFRKNGIGIENSEVNNSFTDDKYHFHVATFNNNEVRYYVDGKLIYKEGSGLKSFGQQFFLSGAVNDTKISENTFVNGSVSKGSNPTVVAGYKNGTLYTPANLYIGQSFFGSLDEVRVYNKILTDSEIKTLYNITK